MFSNLLHRLSYWYGLNKILVHTLICSIYQWVHITFDRSAFRKVFESLLFHNMNLIIGLLKINFNALLDLSE